MYTYTYSYIYMHMHIYIYTMCVQAWMNPPFHCWPSVYTCGRFTIRILLVICICLVRWIRLFCGNWRIFILANCMDCFGALVWWLDSRLFLFLPQHRQLVQLFNALLMLFASHSCSSNLYLLTKTHFHILVVESPFSWLNLKGICRFSRWNPHSFVETGGYFFCPWRIFPLSSRLVTIVGSVHLYIILYTYMYIIYVYHIYIYIDISIINHIIYIYYM